jgi:ADP-ribosylglycohydrolase
VQLSDTSTPLFSLQNGEGAGAPLAAAAGDVAGGRSEIGYSFFTQQATLVAYHLMRYDGVDRPVLSDDLTELTTDGVNPSVYRAPSEQFQNWLTEVTGGEAAATAEPSVEPAVRSFAVGVWFRRDPGRLVTAAMATARLTHIDAASVIAATAIAGATAASSFAQSGRDLILGSAEIADRALTEITVEDYLYSRVDEAKAMPARIRQMARWVGASGEELLERIADKHEPVATDWPLLAIVLAASYGVEPYRLIETAALLGGSQMGAMVGAIVGARVGIRSWPWVVPNDTWFAEIGRRLVKGSRETRDIPVPYQVEERLTYGMARDLLERP